jgi:NitT/TauT family transport system permease protein
MKYAKLVRLVIIVGLIGLLEVLCRTGVITRFTMQPPSLILRDLADILITGRYNAAIAKTLSNSAIAFVSAVVVGIAAGVVIHGVKLLREALDPLFATYYAIPVLAFYPLLIILFGLGDAPQIIIGFMLGVVAVIVNTLNGLDRVPRVLLKTTLPFAVPFVLTGVKLALAYSLIGVIGSEFIMSTGGMGFEISFAYNNFDNATMYPLIVLVLVTAIALNMLVRRWERVVLGRRGLQ